MPPLPPPEVPRRSPRLLLATGLVAVIAVAILLVVVLRPRGSSPGSGGPIAGRVFGTQVACTDGRPTETSVALVPPTNVVPGENQPVTVVGCALPRLPDPGELDPAVGETPPVLHGFDFGGTAVDVVPGGSAKLVVFVAHWCPHCNKEIPVLEHWAEATGIPDGLEIIGVSTKVTPDAEHYPPSKWLAELAWRWPVLADSNDMAAAQAWGLPGFPYFVLVGTDGKVLLRFSGEVPEAQLDALVRAALARQTA